MLRWKYTFRLAILAAVSAFVSCTQDETPTAPSDFTPPTIQWITPASGSTLSDTTRLQFEISDNSRIDSVRVYRNGFAPADWFISEQALSNNSLLWNTAEVEDGLYILEIRAWDEFGNIGISPSLVVQVQNHRAGGDDRTPPEIWWESPAAGSVIEGSADLKVKFRDASDIDSVRFIHNGFTVITQSVSADSMIYSWNTESDSDGVHIWEARAWDMAGNLGNSSGLLVRVQNQPPGDDHNPPVIEWISPEPGDELVGIVTLCFQILDDTEVDSVRISKNGHSPAGFYLPGQGELDYEFSWDTSTDPDGICLLEIRAWDTLGNLGISTGLVVNIKNNPPVDITSPDIWWISPEPGSTLSDSVTLFLGTYDESGLDSLKLFKDGLFCGYGIHENEEWTFHWDTVSDSDGVHIWEARVWDAAGNEGRSSNLLVRVRNNDIPPDGDRTPPTILWSTPESGDTLEGLITIQVEALDNDQIDSLRLYINGARSSITTLNGQEDIHYDLDWTTADYPDGIYNLEARAWDRTGNIGFSEPLSVTIWNNRPRLIWVPDDYETIQDAINASHDKDTIIVRSGEYHEQLQFFDKNVSLISEDGPEETIINGDGFYSICWIGGGQDSTSLICGFTFINPSEFQCYCLSLEGVGIKVVNNIFSVPNSNGYGIISGFITSKIRNNLFINLRGSADMALCWGEFENNMIINARNGLWNAANAGQPLVPDFNLFWNVDNLFGGNQLDWGEDNIENQEPNFLGESYRLGNRSPGVDQGNPDLSDPDGSRSDIGVYGGPYAY